MTDGSALKIRRPRTDDRAVSDVSLGLFGYPALVVAHRMGLFPLLAEKPCTVAEVCEALDIEPRPANVILTVAASLGFLDVRDDRYSLTTVAQDYLLESSPTYAGFIWDMFSGGPETLSIAGIERAVRTNKSQVFGGEHPFDALEQAERARVFTRGMHSGSMGAALAWPDAVDLSEHRRMLDVGGGSGAHSIGAATRWPQLDAIVFDMPTVCEVADEYIAQYALQERIQTIAGDMWEDEFPEADLHFYSHIYHDWSPDKGRLLTEKSFQSLPPGGRIIIHEVLYDDDKSGPFQAAAFSVAMLTGSVDGGQYSGRELSTMLIDAGFGEIQITPTFGYYSILAASKP